MRVIYPSEKPMTAKHADADFYHDQNEVNFWVPLTRAYGNNSLYWESEPGKADYDAFELDGNKGEAVRFYGTKCEHFTKANDTPDTRVSFDFRILPLTDARVIAEKHKANNEGELKSGGGYYTLMHRCEAFCDEW